MPYSITTGLKRKRKWNKKKYNKEVKRMEKIVAGVKDSGCKEPECNPYAVATAAYKKSMKENVCAADIAVPNVSKRKWRKKKRFADIIKPLDN